MAMPSSLTTPDSLPSSWVQPASPVQPCKIKCSTLDNLTAPVYPSPSKFFPLKLGADPRQLYEECKRGLARCIFEHPHLAGVLAKDETGRNSIEIRAAPYAGTAFPYRDHRGDYDMPSYEEFRIAGWPFADGERDGLSKLRPDCFPCGASGDPIVAPQFNVIKGGIVLTMSIAHAIGDLVQFMEFVTSWARNTCAVATARAKGQPEPPLSQQIEAHLVDRTLLSPGVQTEKDLDKLTARAARLPHLILLDPRDPETMARAVDSVFTKARLTHRDLASSVEDDLRNLSCSVWTFPQSSVKRLQRIATATTSEGPSLSAIDCLTAFAWQRYFEAKWAPHEPSAVPVPKTTRVVIAGNIRRRLTPPLPHKYMPACIDLFPVTVKVDKFTPPSPVALAEAARAIRNSNTQWSEGQFREMLEIAQAHPLSPGIVPAGPIDALVTDHTRAAAGLQEDWGPGLGQCEAFREPYLGRVPPHGEITLMPRWANGAIDILFAGESVVIERLRKDRAMNAVASCRFVMDDFVQRTAKVRDMAKL
jgi:hypothetical protein